MSAVLCLAMDAMGFSFLFAAVARSLRSVVYCCNVETLNGDVRGKIIKGKKRG